MKTLSLSGSDVVRDPLAPKDKKVASQRQGNQKNVIDCTHTWDVKTDGRPLICATLFFLLLYAECEGFVQMTICDVVMDWYSGREVGNGVGWVAFWCVGKGCLRLCSIIRD